MSAEDRSKVLGEKSLTDSWSEDQSIVRATPEGRARREGRSGDARAHQTGGRRDRVPTQAVEAMKSLAALRQATGSTDKDDSGRVRYRTLSVFEAQKADQVPPRLRHGEALPGMIRENAVEAVSDKDPSSEMRRSELLEGEEAEELIPPRRTTGAGDERRSAWETAAPVHVTSASIPQTSTGTLFSGPHSSSQHGHQGVQQQSFSVPMAHAGLMTPANTYQQAVYQQHAPFPGSHGASGSFQHGGMMTGVTMGMSGPMGTAPVHHMRPMGIAWQPQAHQRTPATYGYAPPPSPFGGTPLGVHPGWLPPTGTAATVSAAMYPAAGYGGVSAAPAATQFVQPTSAAFGVAHQQPAPHVASTGMCTPGHAVSQQQQHHMYSGGMTSPLEGHGGQTFQMATSMAGTVATQGLAGSTVGAPPAQVGLGRPTNTVELAHCLQQRYAAAVATQSFAMLVTDNNPGEFAISTALEEPSILFLEDAASRFDVLKVDQAHAEAHVRLKTPKFLDKLDSLSSEAVVTWFCDDYLAYRRKCGMRPAIAFVHPSVQDLLDVAAQMAGLPAPVTHDVDCLLLLLMHTPTGTDQRSLLSSLKKLRLESRNGITGAEVQGFIQRWRRQLLQHGAAQVEPRAIAVAFWNHVPTALRTKLAHLRKANSWIEMAGALQHWAGRQDQVRFAANALGMSDVAKRDMVAAAPAPATSAKHASGAAGPSSTSAKPKKPKQVAATRDTRPDQRPPMVCYGCGQEGHGRQRCPNKGNADFVPAGKGRHPAAPQAPKTSTSAGGAAAPTKSTPRVASARSGQVKESSGLMATTSLPDVHLLFSGPSGGHVKLRALCDTGAEVSLVSASVAAQLRDLGCEPFTVDQSVALADDSTIRLTQGIDVSVIMQPRGAPELPVQLPVRLYVADLRSHDVILSEQFVSSSGLLAILAERADPRSLGLEPMDCIPDHTPQFVAGVKNALADCASRLPVLQSASCLVVTRAQAKAQRRDVDSGSPASEDRQRSEPEVSEDQKQAWLAEVHCTTQGHFGVNETLRRLRARGRNWPRMRDDVRRFVDSCSTCQRVWQTGNGYIAATRNLAVTAPFQRWAIDLVGPFPPTAAGNRYLVVATDVFSRFVEIGALPDKTAATVASFVAQLFGRWGFAELYSDHGGEFDNEILRRLERTMGVEHIFSIPHRSQSNGVVERANKECQRHLRALSLDLGLPDAWDTMTPQVMRFMNGSLCRSTGMAPATMVFGDRVDVSRLPSEKKGEGHRDNSLGDWWHVGDGKQPTADQLRQLHVSFVSMQEALIAQANEEQQRVLEARATGSEQDLLPTVGDLVLVKYHKKSHRLLPTWQGPAEVTAIEGVRVTVKNLATEREVDVHVSRLRAYNSDRTEDPKDVAQRGGREWFIESILHHRAPSKSAPPETWVFKVRWLGFDESEDSWLPFQELRETVFLRQYLADRDL